MFDFSNIKYEEVNEAGETVATYFGNAAIAKMLGVSEELVQIILEASKNAGYEVHTDDADLENYKTKVEETETAVKELGAEPVNINIDCNIDDVGTEIEKAKAELRNLREEKNDLTDETAIAKVDAQIADAESKLEYLIQRKIQAEQPAFMSIKVDDAANAELQEALTLVQNYQTALNELNRLNANKDYGLPVSI